MEDSTIAAAENPDREHPRRRRRRVWRVLGAGLIAAIVLGVVLAFTIRVEYVYVPSQTRLLNPIDFDAVSPYVDHWGHTVASGTAGASPAEGGVPVGAETLRLGRHEFYAQTFRNEDFTTDVAGLLDGPLSPWQIGLAVAKLRGRGTTNLRVRLSEDAIVGGREFRKGQLIDTGIDVPRGAWAPVGMKTVWDRGRIKGGVTCAACHSAVDPHTMLLVEGAPNLDLDMGLLLALATNSAAYFTNTGVDDSQTFARDGHRLAPDTPDAPTVVGRDGVTYRLPDPVALEDHVDRVFLSWPKGTFDSTVDLVTNPSQIPDSFTRGDHPFGWTGFAAVGPFRGLSTLNNNVHALNSDGLSHAEGADGLYGFDPEVMYAIILRNATQRRYRWDPASGERPSEFFFRVNPTPPTPGLVELVALPTFPKGSFISPDGLFVSTPGFAVWEQNNAISAFQDHLRPPPPPERWRTDAATLARGRAVFEGVGCVDCHAGAAHTINELVSNEVVGASPRRGTGNRNSLAVMVDPPLTWAFDAPVPMPDGSRVLQVPTDHLREQDVTLSHGRDGVGGYKTKGLIGLAWSPPYLHDSGVAVGPDVESDVGLPGTLGGDVLPDAYNSLKALVDRELRRRVVAANAADADAVAADALGIGHEHWADAAAGISSDDQHALLLYLLNLTDPGPIPAGP